MVYSYLRFSDPRQAAGHSAERQAQYAARWAADRGLVLDESLTLRDEGLSAFHSRHVKSGALGVFLEAVRSGRVGPGSVLVVEGLDRLSRAEPLEAQAQLTQIINAGITVVTASDGREYSREALRAQPMDLIYSLLVMIRAHEESATKSARVKAQIRRQCEGWIAGTWRGIIRQGRDPLWVELKPATERGTGADAWRIVPAAADMARRIVDMYVAGYGATAITQRLGRVNPVTSTPLVGLQQVYRVVAQQALRGVREIELDGQVYQLPGYYPPLLSDDEWASLQAARADRGKRRAKGQLPGIVTGARLLYCGYCGCAMVASNLTTRKRRDDGLVHDGHRRLQCSSKANGVPCSVASGGQVRPVEKAVVDYCSDQIRLSRLTVGDRPAALRAEIAQAQAADDKLREDLDRLTEAMLAASADGGPPPSTWARRAREIEAQRSAEQARMSALEADLARMARADGSSAAQAWAVLAHDALELQDYDARVRARRLVADTFARIVVWSRGMRPGEAPDGALDVLLVSHHGVSRMLRVDRAGAWIAGVETEVSVP